MSNLDKTFCASPNCKNVCGRQMSEKDKGFLQGHPWYPVSYGYFCGEPQFAISRIGDPDNFDVPNDVVITNLE